MRASARSFVRSLVHTPIQRSLLPAVSAYPSICTRWKTPRSSSGEEKKKEQFRTILPFHRTSSRTFAFRFRDTIVLHFSILPFVVRAKTTLQSRPRESTKMKKAQGTVKEKRRGFYIIHGIFLTGSCRWYASSLAIPRRTMEYEVPS